MNVRYDGFHTEYSREGFGYQEHGSHASRQCRPPQVAMVSRQVGPEVQVLMGVFHELFDALAEMAQKHYPQGVAHEDNMDVLFYLYRRPALAGVLPRSVSYQVRMSSVMIHCIRKLNLTETLHAFMNLSRFLKTLQQKFQDSEDADDNTSFEEFNDYLEKYSNEATDNPADEIHHRSVPLYNALFPLVSAFSHNTQQLRAAVLGGEGPAAWKDLLSKFIWDLSAETADRIIVSLEVLVRRHQNMHALLCKHGPSLSVYVKGVGYVDSPHTRPILITLSYDHATISDLIAVYDLHVNNAANPPHHYTGPLPLVFFTVSHDDINHKTHTIINGTGTNLSDRLSAHVRDHQLIWIARSDFDFTMIQEPEQFGMIKSKWL